MKEETQKELIILFALIRATSNQTLMIDNKDLQHLLKQSFNRVQREADKMYKLLDKTNELNGEVFDEILDAIEDNTGEIRKSIKLVAD
jgi:hypothetical protein